MEDRARSVPSPITPKAKRSKGLPGRVTRTLELGLYPEARCLTEGCGWKYPHSAHCLELVRFHVKQTGHTVEVESVTRGLYELLPR